MNSIYELSNPYISITAFYAWSLPEFHMISHTHPSCEIMYVTSGSCEIICDGNTFQLTQNQFIFLDAFIPHQLEVHSSCPCSILNLEFCCKETATSISLAELLCNSNDFHRFCQSKIPYIISSDQRNLGYSMKDLISQLKRNDKDSLFLIRLLFHRVLIELSYCVNYRNPSTGLHYLRKACDYIEKNLSDTIRIPDLAAYAGVNKSYLQALFSQILNCTITVYINQKRLEKAKYLLINSSMHITDIAFLTGYNSRQHFAHTFEKYNDISPLKYRKLHSRNLLPDTGTTQYLLDEETKNSLTH